jgi:rhodanese-related sulfurtransferase
VGQGSAYVGDQMNEITVEELRASRAGNAADWQWVDVRSGNEYAAGHVPGAVNIPLEQIEARLDDVSTKVPLVLICKSGTRARIAAGLLRQCRENVTVLSGGTEAWANAGLPLVVNRATRWSLDRQVRLAAGLIAMAGVVLAAMVNFRWMYLSGFVGLGLTFAGLTDICAMGALLAKMPWNRARICAVPAGKDSAGDEKVADAIGAVMGGSDRCARNHRQLERQVKY